MQLRFATGGAAAGWAEVQRSVSPFQVSSEEAVLHEMEHGPVPLARFVVVEDGEVLGFTQAHARGPGEVRATVQVHADHRGRGVGRLLFERLLRVVGGAAVSDMVNGDDRSRAVAEHWGFTLGREHLISAVDPREAPAPGPTPDGLRLASLDEVGPEAVWQCYRSAAGDDPSGLSGTASFETFRTTRWTDPRNRPDLGRAVVADDVVVAYSEVEAVEGRAWHAMTACRREHRGRGLATLVKSHTLRAAAADGVTVCSTGNDHANAAMRAVNERLGYRHSASVWSARRTPGSSSRTPGRSSLSRP
jgi:GNAT superfamily N-acetyltransferase